MFAELNGVAGWFGPIFSFRMGYYRMTGDGKWRAEQVITIGSATRISVATIGQRLSCGRKLEYAVRC